MIVVVKYGCRENDYIISNDITVIKPDLWSSVADDSRSPIVDLITQENWRRYKHNLTRSSIQFHRKIQRYGMSNADANALCYDGRNEKGKSRSKGMKKKTGHTGVLVQE